MPSLAREDRPQRGHRGREHRHEESPTRFPPRATEPAVSPSLGAAAGEDPTSLGRADSFVGSHSLSPFRAAPHRGTEGVRTMTSPERHPTATGAAQRTGDLHRATGDRKVGEAVHPPALTRVPSGWAVPGSAAALSGARITPAMCTLPGRATRRRGRMPASLLYIPRFVRHYRNRRELGDWVGQSWKECPSTHAQLPIESSGRPEGRRSVSRAAHRPVVASSRPLATASQNAA